MISTPDNLIFADPNMPASSEWVIWDHAARYEEQAKAYPSKREANSAI